jgi:hypothetical protein
MSDYVAERSKFAIAITCILAWIAACVLVLIWARPF